MTLSDRRLDTGIFLTRQPLTLYRIAKTRYADLSGIGSSYAPGRWNLPGQEAIYTSTEIATPVLEFLAHTSKNLIPSHLTVMRIQVSGEWQLQGVPGAGSFLFDNHTGATFYLCETIEIAKELFENGLFSRRRVFGVAVPSVIVPAWNVVLYPLATGFDWHVSLESIEPFQFDPRLFPDNTPDESA